MIAHCNGSSWKEIVTGYGKDNMFWDIWSDGRVYFSIVELKHMQLVGQISTLLYSTENRDILGTNM